MKNILEFEEKYPRNLRTIREIRLIKFYINCCLISTLTIFSFKVFRNYSSICLSSIGLKLRINVDLKEQAH